VSPLAKSTIAIWSASYASPITAAQQASDPCAVRHSRGRRVSDCRSNSSVTPIAPCRAAQACLARRSACTAACKTVRKAACAARPFRGGRSCWMGSSFSSSRWWSLVAFATNVQMASPLSAARYSVVWMPGHSCRQLAPNAKSGAAQEKSCARVTPTFGVSSAGAGTSRVAAPF